MRLKKTAIAAAVLAPALGFAGVNIANADTPPADAAVVVGSGTITPGVPGPTDPCASGNHVTFDGTLSVIAGDDQEVVQGNLHFDGDSSMCETATAGAGAGILSGAAAGNVAYSRNGNIVTVTASAGLTVNGSNHTIVNATCEFDPTKFNPTTEYTLTCHAVLAS